MHSTRSLLSWAFELIHFSNSSSQFFTKEHGHTTMQRFASGLPDASLFFSKEYISVIDCKVLPRPMSSARIAPVPPYRSFFMPWTHSKTKETPSRLCVASVASMASRAARTPSPRWRRG